jgi:DHA2 family multidrug resistance protein
LEYTLEEGPRWDWLGDETIKTTAIIAGVSGPLFLWRSLTFARPVVDLRALKVRNFGLGSLLSFVTGIGIFATIYLTPVFLGRVRGFSAEEIGWAVFSTGCFQIAAIPIYTMLARKIDLRWLMLFGLLCFGAGLWSFTPITHEWGWRELLLPQALRGFAQQFAVAPIVTLSLGSLPPERLKLASGLFNLMRNLGGAIGIAACGTIINDRTNLHFARIAETLNATNAEATVALQALTERYTTAFGGDDAMAKAAALKQLWNLTYREALTQTFSDAFLLIAIALFSMALLAPLMRSITPPKAPSADAH